MPLKPSGPPCPNCGYLMKRNGTRWTCHKCKAHIPRPEGIAAHREANARLRHRIRSGVERTVRRNNPINRLHPGVHPAPIKVLYVPDEFTAPILPGKMYDPHVLADMYSIAPGDFAGIKLQSAAGVFVCTAGGKVERV